MTAAAYVRHPHPVVVGCVAPMAATSGPGIVSRVGRRCCAPTPQWTTRVRPGCPSSLKSSSEQETIVHAELTAAAAADFIHAPLGIFARHVAG
jgi:hypothetical protein